MKEALFNVGDIVKYTGIRRSWTTVNGAMVPVIFPGIEFEIIKTVPPVKGRGFMGNDPEGDPIIDHDLDGYNVYLDRQGNRKRIIPAWANEWELVKANKIIQS